MKILEELWFGNINPQGSDTQKYPRIEQALYLVVKNEDAMRAMLSETQKEQFEKVSDRQSELADLLERRAFAEGFRLAVKLMVDVMILMEAPSVDD